jgi:hypothetical protein
MYVPLSILAIILKYAGYKIVSGRIICDYGYLERMIQFQFANRTVYRSTINRTLINNKEYYIDVLHNFKKDRYFLLVQNKKEALMRTIGWEGNKDIPFRRISCMTVKL